MKFIRNILIFHITVSLMLTGCARTVITGLTTESLTDPEGVQTDEPRFSWRYDSKEEGFRQETYRILVSSSLEKLENGEYDLWDSGERESSDQLLIPYQGKELKSRDKAYWKVITSAAGKRLESPAASFAIAFLEEDCWKGEWIGCENAADKLDGFTEVPARYLRKEFSIDRNPVEAKLYICGLGLYETYINGAAIGDHVLAPTLSDYHKTVYYNVFDVTDKMTEGVNALGVMLGNGRYVSVRPQGIETGILNVLHYGVPRLLYQLEMTFEDGSRETIVSDTSWKMTCEGPIRSNNEFEGEIFDARMDLGAWKTAGYDDSSWNPASRMEAPGGKMTAQPNPNIKVQEVLKPVEIFEKDGYYILDMGQNMVGRIRFKADGLRKGDKVELRFAETLNADTTLYVANLRQSRPADSYIAGEDGSVCWHPTFVYHGFRYVEVTGLREKPSIDDFEGHVMYDEMTLTGSFRCSDPVINQVYENAYWGIRGNYRGVPTDCPQRDERMAWLGDRTTGCYGESYMFDNHLLYAKWLHDISDSQAESGSVPDIAPIYYSLYTDNMTWPGAFVNVTEMVYWRFGDKKVVTDNYNGIKKWLAYMKDRYMSDGLITKDRYGDWCMPPESLEMIFSKDPARITDGAVISTAYYCLFTRKMAELAPVAGHPEDVEFFLNESAESGKAFNKAFFNEQKGFYANNTVTANLLALYFGMVPEDRQKDVLKNIIDKTENECGGHVSTGIVGIQVLLRTLTEYGAPELAYKIASNDTYPSWGYMAKNGATTIWELWNGNTADPAMNSGNHVMLLGDLLIWEYEYLGGIRPIKPGYSEFSLKPYLIDGIDWVECSFDSPYGKIESSWKRNGDGMEWTFTIPANSTADVYVPTSEGWADPVTFSSGTYTIRN